MGVDKIRKRECKYYKGGLNKKGKIRTLCQLWQGPDIANFTLQNRFWLSQMKRVNNLTTQWKSESLMNVCANIFNLFLSLCMSQIRDIFKTFFNHLRRPSLSQKSFSVYFNLVFRIFCFFLICPLTYWKRGWYHEKETGFT